MTAVERLLSVVSELVTNSIQPGPGKPIKLTVAAEGDGLITGEVEDQGSGHVAIGEFSDQSAGGMGLRVVRGLTDRWGVYEGSTHVWFEIKI